MRVLVCLIASFFLVFSSLSGFGQDKDSLLFTKFDTLQSPPEYPYKEWRMFFRLDIKKSFAHSQKTRFNGFNFGMTYKERHRFGLGLYVSKRVLLDNVFVDEPDVAEDSEVGVHVSYLGLFYEYILFNKPKYDVGISVIFANADLTTDYTDTNDVVKPYINEKIPLIELFVGGRYKVLRWVGINGGIGYRFIFTHDAIDNKALSGMVYRVGVGLYLGDLWKMANKKKYPEEHEYWKYRKYKRQNKNAD